MCSWHLHGGDQVWEVAHRTQVVGEKNPALEGVVLAQARRGLGKDLDLVLLVHVLVSFPLLQQIPEANTLSGGGRFM